MAARWRNSRRVTQQRLGYRFVVGIEVLLPVRDVRQREKTGPRVPRTSHRRWPESRDVTILGIIASRSTTIPSRRVDMHSFDRYLTLLATVVVLALGCFHDAAAQTAPSREVIVAWHVTIAPTWFDPSSAPPQITPFDTLYAIHDALVRPLPNQKMGPAWPSRERRVLTALPTSSSCGEGSSSTTA